MANSSKPSRHVAQSSGHDSAPYVGPRPFTREDQDIFFGRNQEALELTSLIKAHPEVLLYAQSGAGKTSLLYAQVMPILDREEEFDVLPSARVRSQESLAIPDGKINNIYMFNALRDLSHDKLSLLERAQFTLAEYLKGQPRPLVRLPENSADQPTEEHSRRLPRVIIFDQFEEIFTLYPERYKDRQDFFSQVSEALEADAFLRVVFSMREDYIAELDPYVAMLPQKLRTRFRLERLRKTNALSAVKKPLETSRFKKTGRQFADGAAESLVERLMLIKVKTASGDKIEVPGEFVDPVQLQVVCQTLWEKLPPDDVMITEEDLDKYANVEEALSDFYENSVRKAVAAANAGGETKVTSTGSLSLITEGAVRGWFDQVLITREGKRNMVLRERETTGGLSNLVVAELENQHLVRVERRSGEPWYELSHDRFIPPIRESNRRWLFQQPLALRKAQELEARANEWLNAHRDRSLLLDRGELLDAQNWLRSPEAAAIGYSETLYSLIRDSEVAVEHEDNERQRILAAEQQRRVVAEQARARQLKIGFAVASFLLVFALGSAVFAFRAEGKATKALGEATAAKEEERKQRERAQEVAGRLKIASAEEQAQRIKAQDQSKEADKQREKAEDARTLAVQSQKAAEKAKGQLQIALAATVEARTRLERTNSDLELKKAELKKAVDQAWSLKLAENANSQLENDPELAFLLALEAADTLQTEQAKYSLRQAYIKSKERRILRGHTKIVRQAVYSPDGQFILTGSDDGTVKMWDARTNRQLKTFEGDEDGVHAIAMSANGTHIATEATAKGRIWNVSDGTFKILDGLTGPVPAIAFNPNGNLVATEATSDNEDEKKAGAAPRIWNVTNGAIHRILLGHDSAVSALAFNPRGDLLATASWDTTARIWDVASGQVLKVLRGHTAPLTSVGFDPTGRLLITGSYDGTARVWDVATGNEKVSPLKGHTGAVHDVAFNQDGSLVLTVGKRVTSTAPVSNVEIPLPPDIPRDEAAPPDNTVRVWDAPTGRQLRVIPVSTTEVTSAAFSADGKMISTATKDGMVRVWEAVTGTKIAQFAGHKGSVNSVAFSPDAKFVLSAGEDHTGQVWTVMSSANVRRIGSGTRGYGQYVQFDPSGETIVSASTDGSVRFRKLTGELKLGGLPVATSVARPYDIAVSPDYKLAVTASIRPRPTRAIVSKVADLDAHVWDLESQKIVKPLKHKKRVTRVAYSPRGNFVLTVSAGTAHVWRTSDWTEVCELKPSEVKEEKSAGSTAEQEGEKGPLPLIVTAAFDPTEKSVVTAENTGHVAVWEIPTGMKKWSFRAHDKGVTSVAFSKKSNARSDSEIEFVTTSSDSTVRVWTLEGKKMATLRVGGDVNSAEFSREGTFIVTTSAAGVQVWDTETGNQITEIKISDGPAGRASFSPDGRSIVTSAGDGFIYVLDCELCRPFDEIMKLADALKPRELTENETKYYMPGKPKAQSP